MSRSSIARLRRALFAISAGAFLWSLVLALTGGFYFRIFGWRVSSRDYHDSLLIGLFFALTAIGLSWRLEGWRTLRDEWVWLSRPLIPVVLRARGPLGTVLRAAPAAAAVWGFGLIITEWVAGAPLWLDEETILLNVRDRTWSTLGGSLWFGQSAPLGWLAVERLALVTLGAGEIALRLVPVLFGIATIAVALWIGRRWLNPLGATVLVLLCTFGQVLSHFPLEAKHYSADAFWAALLPALAVWATEGDTAPARIRRASSWWAAAAVGQLLANGALFVTPGCAAFLGLSILRRDGRRAAMRVALSGLIWLAAFGVNWELSVRATRENTYLYTYWANRMPPPDFGLVDRGRWIAARLPELAFDPGGTTWPLAFWICAVAGLALGRRPALGIAFATVPLSAFILSGAEILPLHERFVLWIVPALYVGLAMITDRAVPALGAVYTRRRWAPTLLAAPMLLLAGGVTWDIYARGKYDIDGRTGEHKHHLDDRAAVRWLMARLKPGDAVMTTRLGWPAVWWYGGISIANTDAHGAVRHPNGVPLLEVEHVGPGSECRENPLREGLEPYRRVLVYVGFRDVPDGFDYLLLHKLDELGAIEKLREYSERGVAAIVDLHDPAARELTLAETSPRIVKKAVPLEGCARVGPARRW